MRSTSHTHLILIVLITLITPEEEFKVWSSSLCNIQESLLNYPLLYFRQSPQRSDLKHPSFILTIIVTYSWSNICYFVSLPLRGPSLDFSAGHVYIGHIYLDNPTFIQDCSFRNVCANVQRTLRFIFSLVYHSQNGTMFILKYIRWSFHGL
jgi:hypothetical protein